MTPDVEIVDSLAQIPPDAWNALVDPDDPFVEHEFLRTLEESGSVGTRESGWLPRHRIARDAQGRIVGAMPVYERYDSFGEFIFDFAWADAARRARIAYYPKLVSAVPFTPVTGRRILLHGELGAERDTVFEALVTSAHAPVERGDVSSLHVLFCTDLEARTLVRLGWSERLSYQFHLHGAERFATFDGYVGAMRNATRKQVRRERTKAHAHGLRLELRTGDALTDDDWMALHRFYEATIAQKGSHAYLTREFFALASERLRHRVVATLAYRGERAVAGALFLRKGASLYGRYWGCVEPIDCLHFELCYYLPIEWGLANGVRRFEAGAQGEQKLKRGFLPNACHSAHTFFDERLGRAVAQSLVFERAHVEAEIALLAAHSPFRDDATVHGAQ